MRPIPIALTVPLLVAACTVQYGPPPTTVAAQPPPPQPVVQQPPPELLPQPAPPPPTMMPSQPPVVFEVPREPVGPPQTLSYAVAFGRPQALRPGAPLGYWIWTDRHGGWHLLSTTRAQPHRFQGTILSERAPITGVRASRLEMGDRIRVRTNAIDFDFTTQADSDGFSFQTISDRCMRFLLTIDGQPAVGTVTLGEGGVRMRASYFRLCP